MPKQRDSLEENSLVSGPAMWQVYVKKLWVGAKPVTAKAGFLGLLSERSKYKFWHLAEIKTKHNNHEE